MSFFRQLSHNWKSALTVALVNIPLSVSLAIAAGATPVMGIITAVWAGLFAAMLGGSHYNIVGPTGALSGILAMFALQHGAGTLPLLAIMTGVIMLAFYLLKWWRYIVFIPGSAVLGFSLGIAFVIALSQLNYALGLQGLPTHSSLIENIFESLKHIASADIPTVSIFITGLIFLFVWKQWLPRFPGAIILSLLGIILGYATSKQLLPFETDLIMTHFGIFDLKLFEIPTFTSVVFSHDFLVASITIAIIGILESLISAKIADGMTGTKSNRSREVFGLGIGNIASGLFGGIPATAALARTALNVKSGATHKTSAFAGSIFVAIISVVMFSYFQYLPLAVVASILVFVAYNMIERKHFVHILAHDRFSFLLALLVATITVVEDPLTGILVGSAISLFVFLNSLSKSQAEVSVTSNHKVVSGMFSDSILRSKDKGTALVYRFSGVLNYINSLTHIETIEKLSKPRVVIFSLKNLYFIDIDGIDALEEMVHILESKNITVLFAGSNPFITSLLGKHAFYQKKMAANSVFEKTSLALTSISAIV